ncbi:hypothetical protein VB10N_38570 [Vibrio sp. 10N]|nr:hypothetical protein VB10N_38570 [Vibrio sp. 10N]
MTVSRPVTLLVFCSYYSLRCAQYIFRKQTFNLAIFNNSHALNSYLLGFFLGLENNIEQLEQNIMQKLDRLNEKKEC